MFDELFVRITVRGIVAIYVINRLWHFFVKNRGVEFKEFLYPTSKAMPILGEPEEAISNEPDVIGLSQTTYLDVDPPIVSQPYRSETLEKEDIYNDELDFSSNDVEFQLAIAETNSTLPLNPDELAIPIVKDVWGNDDDFSTGVTCEEMENATGVLLGLNVEEEDMQKAAYFLHKIKQTEMFDFFTNEIANSRIISDLLDRYIDSDGTLLIQSDNKKPFAEIANFDINQYV